MSIAQSLTVDIDEWPDVQRALRNDPYPPGQFSPGTTYVGGPAYTDAFGAKRAPTPWQLVEKYKSLIYAMVAKNANAVCRVPLRLYVDGSRANGGKPRSACDPIKATRSVGRHLARSGLVSPSAVDKVYEIRQHPGIDLLDKPDPYGYFNRSKLISLMVRSCDVIGSAFLFPDWDGWDIGRKKPKRVPDYLWVLYAQYVLPIRRAANPLVDVFQYFSSRLPYETVLWFRQNHSLRDPYGSGYSPTYAGDQYSQQEDRFVAIYDQVLGLGPRPSLIASAKDPLQPPGEAERKRLEQDAQRRHAAGNAGNILVNTGAWDFTPVSYSPADMAGKEVCEYDVKILATIFGQPPTYYTVDTNLANLQAADQQHARDGVDPRCKMISEALTLWIRQYDERLFWEFDATLPEDEELKERVIDMKLKNGSITINQANEDSQWPPVDYGDEPWLPSSLIQPSMAQQRHEQSVLASQIGMEATLNGGVAPEESTGKPGVDDEQPDSGRDTPDTGDDGVDGGDEDQSRSAIHAGSIDARFDAVLLALERSMGL